MIHLIKFFGRSVILLRISLEIPYSMPTWNALGQETWLNQFEQNLHNIFLCCSTGTSTLLSEAAIGGVP